jgi:kinesin family protein 5
MTVPAGLNCVWYLQCKENYIFQITEYEKDLADCRLLISQHEARMKTLQESMREAENKKRTLEEDVDSLREECAKLKAAGKLNEVS